jgi:transcriptional regulator with XRE-family HTH domain
VAGIGRNLKRIREEKDISQTDIARGLRTTSGQVNKWERKERIDPKASSLLRLAVALECSVEDLVGGMDPDYDRWRETQAVRPQDETGLALSPEVKTDMLPSESHRRLAFLLGYYRPEDLALIVDDAKEILDKAIEERRARGRSPHGAEDD